MGVLTALKNMVAAAKPVAPPKGPRTINAQGLGIIKEFEGVELTSYLCPADIRTVGYGHTGPDVRLGMTITLAEAERLLRKDVAKFEQAVARLTGGVATDNQFSALVSFAFNLGEDALRARSCRLLGSIVNIRRSNSFAAKPRRLS